MEISPHNTVGIGDAENDHALLASCECSAAVSNALPTLKNAADIVTSMDHGAGVVQLIEEILRDDLASREPQLLRHHILVGATGDGQEVRIPPHGETLLLVGTNNSGKSELATGLMERLAIQGYTFCVIDVEGDYGSVAKAVALGSPTRPPTANEILMLLRSADKSAVVNLSGLPEPDRLPFLTSLTPRLAQLRAQSGHPHWVAIDETHHLLPAGGTPCELLPMGEGESVLHITERPALVASEVVRATTLLMAIGTQAQALLEEFCQVRGIARPEKSFAPLKKNEALLWRPGPNAQPLRLNIASPQRDAVAISPRVEVEASGVENTIQRPANARTRSLH